MTIAAMSRNSINHMRAVEWLEQYFWEHCDRQPNKKEATLDLTGKKDIYDIYENEVSH
jgi:hypothetical protein